MKQMATASVRRSRAALTHRRAVVEALERRELLALTAGAADEPPVNRPPIAVEDALVASQGAPLLITSEMLLANDTDADGDQLKVTLAASGGPTNGTLSLSGAGNFVYQPKPGFVGTDRFLYFAWDGQAFSAATAVTIAVQPLVPRPEARDDFYSTPAGKVLDVAAPGVLANDGWTGPMPLGATPNVWPLPGLQAELVAGPQHGELKLHSNGSFQYTPPATFTGLVRFTYRAVYRAPAPAGTTADQPAVASNVATVTIEVKPSQPIPEARPDFYTTPAGAELKVADPGVLANDRSPSSRDLFAILVTPPQSGTLSLSPHGGFTYKPASGFVGVDSFVYRATDVPPSSLDPATGAPIGNTSFARVTISVTPLEPLPEARNDTYSMTQGGVLSVAAAAGVLANDTAPAGQTLTAALLVEPKHGRLELAANGGFVYRPAAEFFGVDYFTYRATGSPATGSASSNGMALAVGGEPASDPNTPPVRPPDIATVAIYVRPLQPPPYAQDDQYATTQGTALTVPAPGVLANDKRPDGVALMASLVRQPEHGEVVLNPNGSFTYKPNGTFSGIDTFQYEARAAATTAAGDANVPSSVATVVIFVRPLVPPAEARPDTFSTSAGTPLVVPSPGVLGNDSAPAGYGLRAVLLTKPQGGELAFEASGGFTYTPPADFTGAVTFTYQAVAVPASTPPPTTQPAPGTPAGSNTLPEPILPGDIATVTIFVKPQVPSPLAMSDTFSLEQGGTLRVEAPGVLKNDLGPVGLVLAAELVEGHGPAHGRLELLPSGGFTYIPDGDFFGTDTFLYRAKSANLTSASAAAANWSTSDPGNSPLPPDIAVVTIYVVPQRQPIEARADVYSTRKNELLRVAAPGVLANDVGPAGQRLVATLVSPPEQGEIKLELDGSFTFAPRPDYVGPVKFTYRASVPATTAGNPATSAPGAIATVVIHVLADDPIPLFLVGARHDSTDESGPQQVADFLLPVVASGSSPTALAPVVTNDNPALFKEQPSIDAAGRLHYTPAPNVSGSATVTVALPGATAVSAAESRTFTITIAKPRPLMNVINPRDVDGDNFVAPGDALLVINHINRVGQLGSAEGEAAPHAYLDVSGDNAVSPLDALLVINYLNLHGRQPDGEGEAAVAVAIAEFNVEASTADAAAADARVGDLVALLAAEASQRRRK